MRALANKQQGPKLRLAQFSVSARDREISYKAPVSIIKLFCLMSP